MTTFVDFWHFLLTFDNLCQLLTTCDTDNFWQLVTAAKQLLPSINDNSYLVFQVFLLTLSLLSYRGVTLFSPPPPTSTRLKYIDYCFQNYFNLWWIVIPYNNLWWLLLNWDDSWWPVTTCNNLWQLVTFCDNLWLLVTTRDDLWLLVTPCDHLWGLVRTCDNFWQLLTTFDCFWRTGEHVYLERFSKSWKVWQKTDRSQLERHAPLKIDVAKWQDRLYIWNAQWRDSSYL